MHHRALELLAAFGLLLSLDVTAHAAGAPGAKCASAKQGAVGKYLAAAASCYAKAAKLEASVDPTCLTKAEDKLTATFLKLDAKGDCATTEDAGAILRYLADVPGHLAQLLPGRKENCGNGVDDNGNGAIDCEDVTCNLAPSCHELSCNDGSDNDDDGLTDCEDDDCLGSPACNELACNDGVDNDNDGAVDCDDPDCSANPTCLTCGDHVLQSFEECDGSNLRGESCLTQGFAGGTLRCTSQCHYDYSGCD